MQATTQTQLNTELQLRIDLSQSEPFKTKVLMLAVRIGHQIMNQETDDKNQRTKMKVVELLNSPEAFRDRLALSVAAIMKSDYFLGNQLNQRYDELEFAVIDCLDALAGQGI